MLRTNETPHENEVRKGCCRKAREAGIQFRSRTYGSVNNDSNSGDIYGDGDQSPLQGQ